MTTTYPTPADESALPHAFNDAYGQTKSARRAAVAAAAAYVAHLIRPHLPAAATITVDTADGELRMVRDSNRSVLWYAPTSAGAGLPDLLVLDIEGVMRDILEFGADEKALEDAGWENPGAHDSTYDLQLPGAPDACEVRAYFVAGRNESTGYTLMDVVAAPTDETKRATAHEEATVDALDVFAEISTVWAPSAREAVTTLLADYAARTRHPGYGLTEASNTKCLEDPERPAAGPLPGRARAAAVVGGVCHDVEAAYLPSARGRALSVSDVDGAEQWETRDRIRAALVNSGFDGPDGSLAVRTTWTGGASAGDLAVACALLTAVDRIPAAALGHVALIGELGLNGSLRPIAGASAAVAAARDAGYRLVIVPAEHGGIDVPGIAVSGAADLAKVVELLELGGRMVA